MSSRDHEMERLFTRRALAAGLIGGGAFGVLAARLFQLQVLENETYDELATRNRINLEIQPARRGVIFDRFGAPLAVNRRDFRVSIVRENTPDMVATLNRLSAILPISSATRERVLEQARRRAKFVPIVVADDLTWEEFSRLNVHTAELAGVRAEVGEVRAYPRGDPFAHVIGYVARANEREAGSDRLLQHPDVRIGKSGAEAFGEEWLRGKGGFRRVVMNALGRVVEVLPSDDLAAVPGRDMVVSLDADLQEYAAKRLGEEAGSAVVMDVKTGQILTMVSTPGYDPNLFVNGISQTAYNTLLENERRPLFHKAYDGFYPPGSTFKMVVATAALESGLVDGAQRVNCIGHMSLGGRRFHCWKRGGHGVMNMHEAIKHSCDIYFYDIALKVGPQRISSVAHRLGLGEDWDLGLPGGGTGDVPDPVWKRAKLNEPWYQGDTVNYGIGQGYTRTSPLQLAVMTARLAAKGAAIFPTVILDGPQTPPPPAVTGQPLATDDLDPVLQGMFGVSNEPGGTALSAGRLDLGGVQMAGKTGTAQVRNISAAERATGMRKNEDLHWRLRDHALFVGYAPADNPRYAISVVVDHGGSGSKDAAPIARDILREALIRDPLSRPVYAPGARASFDDPGQGGTEPA